VTDNYVCNAPLRFIPADGKEHACPSAALSFSSPPLDTKLSQFTDERNAPACPSLCVCVYLSADTGRRWRRDRPNAAETPSDVRVAQGRRGGERHGDASSVSAGQGWQVECAGDERQRMCDKGISLSLSLSLSLRPSLNSYFANQRAPLRVRLHV